MSKLEFELKWSRKDKKTGNVSKMPSGDIIKSLRNLQKKGDSILASEARALYPDDLFVKYFSYVEKGCHKIMISEKAIAKRYVVLTSKNIA